MDKFQTAKSLIKTIFKMNKSNVEKSLAFMQARKKPDPAQWVEAIDGDVMVGDDIYPQRLKDSTGETPLIFHFTGELKLLDTPDAKLVWWGNESPLDSMVSYWEKEKWLPVVKPINGAIAGLAALKVPYVVIDEIYGAPRENLDLGHFLWLTDVFGDYAPNDARRAQERFGLALCDIIVKPENKSDYARLRRNSDACRDGVVFVSVRKEAGNA